MTDSASEYPIGHDSNRLPRSISSLEEQLKRQINYLKRSAKIFDEGFEDEAPRLATTLRVLLHDTRNSTSLLKLLGIKDRINFRDTGLYRDRLNTALQAHIDKTFSDGSIACITPGEAGLVIYGINRRGERSWIAPLLRPRLHPNDPKSVALLTTQPFLPWWKTPLVESSNQRLFSRQNLVLIMSNQDGGAHVDQELDKDYDALTIDYLGHQYYEGNLPLNEILTSQSVPFKNISGNVAAASVRQIAHEVLETIANWQWEERKKNSLV